MNTNDDDIPVPHYAVIFSNQRTDADDDLYEETGLAMAELAAQQPGYISHESTRGADGFGITISYWTDMDSIQAWKKNVEHMAAQRLGFDKFYDSFTLRIARVDTVRRWER